VAIEWVVPVGVAVGKLLLRVSGQPDIADAIGDAQEGWRRLQRSQRQQDVIGRAISDRLEKRLAPVTDRDEARDLGAAAQDVANLISRLADDDEAVRVAAAHPEQFLSYAKQQGGDNLRRLTSEAATPLFDQILEAAATEFADLAPSSSRFVSASLTEVLRQVEAMPEIQQNSRRSAEVGDQILAVVMAQRARDGEPAVSSPNRKVIAQLRGKTENELDVQLRVVRVVQEFPDLAYEPDGIPPGRARAAPKPSAIVVQIGGDRDTVVQDLLDRGVVEEPDAKPDPAAAAKLDQLINDQPWVAVQYVPKLEAETVDRVVEDNFLATMILIVSLDGSAIAAWVAVARAYPMTLPSLLEIDQDWPLERVVREALKRSFPSQPAR
jgi:hypothetical protein